MNYDVAVIGCGAVGASCAHQLSQRGLSVVVLEQAEAPATGSSGRSAAGVRVQFAHETNVAMSKLSLSAFAEFEELHGEDIGYRPIGYLLLVPESGWPDHLEAVKMQRRLGVPVEVLAPNEIAQHTPLQTDGLGGATFGPIDGVVDPHWLTHAWVKLARSNGCSFEFEQPVRSIERDSSTWSISTDTLTVNAPHIVNAAGAWSGRVAGLAGLALPVEPMRNMIMLSSSLEPQTPQQRRFPMTIDVGSGFYLRSEGDKLLFGLTNENEPHGFTAGMNWPWLETILGAGTNRFPWLKNVGVDYRGSWWGYYEMTPDHNPIIGLHPDACHPAGPVWIDASGFSGHGIMHTPATGLLVAELATTGKTSTIDIAAFAHSRFEQTEAKKSQTQGERNAY